MARPLKITLAVVLASLALIAVLLASSSHLNWNGARPWIADKVEQATGRSFAINGDLSFSWERPPEVQGWARYVPWPHFRAFDVVLGNPSWATTGPAMAKVRQIDFTLSLLKLLTRTVSVERLRLTEPDLVFEQDRKNRNNWTFKKKEDQPSAWTFQLQQLAIASGNVRYVDPGKSADVATRIDTEADGSVRWKLAGRFNDEKVSGEGTAGALLALQSTSERYPVQALVKVGQTTITAKGTITNPSSPEALDIQVKLLGASMADLFPISGLLLPETPKFSTEGRVVGRIEPGKMHLRYEKFSGKVGSSDIGGTLEYQQRTPRPLLRGEVVSNQLDIDDLRRLIGSGEHKQKKDEVRQPPDRVLPVSPFKTDRWGKMDVQVKLSGHKIIRSKELPIDNLTTDIRMENGVLSLDPLRFGIAGGRLEMPLSIDGRADPAKARLAITASKVRLSQLFPKVQSAPASFGEISGQARLSGEGNSIAALLGSSNGEIKSLISRGTVSKFVLEAAGLNLGSVLIAKLFGDRQTQLNCMAADLAVKDGLMQPRVFLMDTADATIHVTGNINLKSEKYDLTVHPDSKGIRLFSLRSPLYVRGTFKDPELGVDKGAIAMKAGVATVLGVAAAPIAGLLALINPGPEEDSPCAALLKQATEKPKAPPPGKTLNSGQSRR